MLKKIKARAKSKTYRLGVFYLALTFTDDNFNLISQYLGEYANLTAYVVGFLILYMREITTGSLSEKVENKDAQEH